MYYSPLRLLLKYDSLNGKNAAANKIKRLRFREEDDLALLREVLSLNPFENPNSWCEIQELIFLTTGKKFVIKTLRDHLLLLIKLWLEKTKILKDNKKKRKDTNLGKINRDYWAKESIKENVGSSSNCGIEDNSPSSLLLDHNYATEEVVVLADEEIETGGGASSQLEDTADEAGLATNEVTQTAKVSSGSKRTILARNKARTRRTSIQRQGLAYLQEYENTQNELKRKDQELLGEKLKIEEGKLELEKKRLELEERKLVLREFESKKNLQMQEDRFNELNKIISNQDRLINVLLNQTK
ncbi:hypothetical protein FQR65_LT09481 [Abscondita terminalis]|nr:hypothetical protein FQR65_LT09481 [Abscondita terminalis]